MLILNINSEFSYYLIISEERLNDYHHGRFDGYRKQEINFGV